jgi:hypothetical protein
MPARPFELRRRVHASGQNATGVSIPDIRLRCDLAMPRPLDEPDALTPAQWPTTIDATVADILARMSEEDKKKVRETKADDLILFHFGWGAGLRNYYGLFRGNDKLIASACGGPCHPDDASMKIIEAVWHELNGTRP